MRPKRDKKSGRFIATTCAYIDDRGYPRMSSGPLRGIRIHRILAEAKLGRTLKKDEDVHHLDGDKLNFAPENIQVLGHREHGCVSAKQHWYVKTNNIKMETE